MSKRILVLTAMMLVFVMIMAGCGKKQSTDPTNDVPTMTDETSGILIRETLVYYQDDVGYLVPVMRKIPWEEGIAKATLRVMMDTAEQQEDLMMMGLRALLPTEAKIIGMSISEEGVASVDFNNAVLETKDAVSEVNMVQGLVLTLAGFSTIEKVQFLFEGETIDTMKYGTKVADPLGPEDINLEISDSGVTQGAKVMVFFQSVSPSQYEYLIPITRITSSINSTLETAIEELLDGPKEISNLNIDIPQGTKLLGVRMEDGITYINFSKEFSALANSAQSEAIVLKAIIMTARQFSEVDQVKILVEGKDYEGKSPTSAPVFANKY